MVATERTDRSLIKMKLPVKRHYFSKNYFNMDIEKVHREAGSYNIYSEVCSLCDMLRLKDEQKDEKLIAEVYDSIKQKEKQYQRLLKYVELFRIKNLP